MEGVKKVKNSSSAIILVQKGELNFFKGLLPCFDKIILGTLSSILFLKYLTAGRVKEKSNCIDLSAGNLHEF